VYNMVFSFMFPQHVCNSTSLHSIYLSPTKSYSCMYIGYIEPAQRRRLQYIYFFETIRSLILFFIFVTGQLKMPNINQKGIEPWESQQLINISLQKYTTISHTITLSICVDNGPKCHQIIFSFLS
jgi:hypothetical protein